MRRIREIPRRKPRPGRGRIESAPFASITPEVVSDRGPGSDADVLVPEFRTLPDELVHQGDAFRVVENFHEDAARSDVIFWTSKRPVLADHDPRDLVEQGR